MVSSKPVPSQAALNALRGLVFTTSCSVFILAEERRRRMQIARSAFDNARKLHTVKARHRPALLADTRLSDDDCNVLSITKISKPERRKRRPRLRSRSEESDFHNTQQNRIAELGASGDNRIDLPSSPARPPPSGRPLAQTDLPIIGQKSGTPPVHPHVSSRDTFSRPNLGRSISPTSHRSRPKVSPVNRHVKYRVPADFQVGMATMTTVTTPAPQSFDHSYPASSSAMNPELAQAVSDFLVRASDFGKSFDHSVLPLLDTLLVELDPCDQSHGGIASRFKLALDIFQKLSTVGVVGSHGEAMEAKSIALIKYAITLDECPSLALNRTRRFHKDIHKVLAMILNWMIETRIVDRIPVLISAFCNSECSSTGLDGNVIYHILACHATLYQEPSRTIELYHILYQPDLPAGADYTPELEPETRQLISYLLQDEMQCRGIYQAAHSPLVYQSGVQSYGSEASRRQFQDILTNLVDSCSQRHEAANFEAIMRYLAQTHGLELKGRWVYSLLERYFRSNGLDTVFSWIQFCLRNNFRVDDGYILRFYQKCHTNWCIPWEEVGKLASLLRKANRDYHVVDCTQAVAPNSEKNPAAASKQSLPARESWERLYIRTARELVSTSKSKGEMRAFDHMQRHAQKCEWSLVWELYETFRATSSVDLSIRCLRLAVLARVRLDGGSTDRANELLWSGSQGHDVSEAATAVLMAQLANGESPVSIIRSALDCGLRVHDMVYNLAARKTIALGHLADAMEICQKAILQNGSGDFLYQEFIFLDLVSIHTLQLHYTDLKLLLAAFIEKKPHWAGTEGIKRMLKLNMKTVVKRIATTPGSTSNSHDEALTLLDMALRFNSDCTKFYAPSTRSKEDINSNMGSVLTSVPDLSSLRLHQEMETRLASSAPLDNVDDTQQVSEIGTGSGIPSRKVAEHSDNQSVLANQGSQKKTMQGLESKSDDTEYQETKSVSVEENSRKENLRAPDPNWDYFSEMEGTVFHGHKRSVFPKTKPKEKLTSECPKDADVLTKLDGDNAHETPSRIAGSETKRLLAGEKKMMYEFLSLQPRVVPGWSRCEVGHET